MQQQTRERDIFIEEMAIFMEEVGLPRMAGRVLGLLLICDPPHLSAAEIGSSLEASKGSISTMTRLLTNMGFVERVGVPQRRQSYFRVRPGVWRGMLATHVAKASAARLLAERGLRARNGGADAGDRRLLEMRDLYAFLESELPALLSRWEASRGRGHAADETLEAGLS